MLQNEKPSQYNRNPTNSNPHSQQKLSIMAPVKNNAQTRRSSISPSKKEVTAIISHNHYSLRSSDPVKRARKAAQVLNVAAPIVKHKEIRPGSGKPLKEIPQIRAALKELYDEGKSYHLGVLHNLMYGHTGTEGQRWKNILNFSGYPADVSRETKLKTMYASGPLRYGNNYYIRLFLKVFGLETTGKKDELYERFLKFMFKPK